MSHAYVKRDYSIIRDHVLAIRKSFNFRYEEDGEVWGYIISKNHPVTELYGFDAYVVRFYFSKVDNLHDQHQEEIMEMIFRVLKKEMEVLKGYYNLRLPAHIVDVIKAFGNVLSGGIFCGGTVEQVVNGKRAEVPKREGLTSFFADREYIDKHRERLMEMTYSSFASYQGQYHISPITSARAGVIYENWIEGYFNYFEENRVYITEYNGKPIGFCTIGEDENVVEGQLSAVSSENREIGAYRTLISSLINYACDRGKAFAASTQFDNYIVQGTWNSMGMKPCFSFYNYHFDTRK